MTISCDAGGGGSQPRRLGGGGQLVEEEEMKRQSAVTSGEGGVSRGAGEGGSDMSDRVRRDQHTTATAPDDNNDIAITYDVRQRKL